MVDDYRVNSQKSTAHVERRWTLHLMAFFSRMRASDLATDRVRRYIDARLAKGAEPATINRELALLKHAFNLARECTPPKVKIVPYIPMLKESNVRRGFVESVGYVRLAEQCCRVGLWMRALLECGYTYGWRVEELLDLRVRQVDLLAGTIRLDPGTTKNDQDHVFNRDDGKPVVDFRARGLVSAAQPELGS